MAIKNIYFFFLAVMLLALLQILAKVFTDTYHFHLAILAGFSLGMIPLGLRAGVKKWLVWGFALLSLGLITLAWFVIWNGVQMWRI